MNTAQENIVERLGYNPNDTEARSEFDRFCSTDPTFREEAALHLAAIGALKQQQKQHLHQIFEAPDMLVFKKQVFRARTRRKWLFRVVFSVVFLGIIYFFIRNKKTESIQQIPVNFPPPSQLKDTQFVDKQPVVEINTPVPHQTNTPKNNYKRLAAQYFSPYDPSLFDRQTRGGKKQEHLFFTYYASADYRNAVANDPVDSLSNIWLFYRANAWMAVDQPEKALPLMEQIDSRQNILLAQQVKWYKALAYLQKNDREAALSLLKSIAEQPDGAYKVAESKALLNRLK